GSPSHIRLRQHPRQAVRHPQAIAGRGWPIHKISPHCGCPFMQLHRMNSRSTAPEPYYPLTTGRWIRWQQIPEQCNLLNIKPIVMSIESAQCETVLVVKTARWYVDGLRFGLNTNQRRS